jgi:hypothetical protein
MHIDNIIRDSEDTSFEVIFYEEVFFAWYCIIVSSVLQHATIITGKWSTSKD